jgi:hypothetical protein
MNNVGTPWAGGSKMESMYGRRGRFDCCTDCGAMLDQMGELWCAEHRPFHMSPDALAATARHRDRIMQYIGRGG